jgi:hypothetical protein
MRVVVGSLREQARSICRELGNGVSDDGRGLRATRKWRAV